MSSLREGRSPVIVVVEIASHIGTRASKEYDAPTRGAAIMAAQQDLQDYPEFRLIDIGTKNQRGETLAEIW